MADTIRMKNAVTLKHQANLGEDVEEVEFSEGTELHVLQTFQGAWLCKDDEGRLFNVKKEQAEEA